MQFGEGGAGTFSDGKLNTGTQDSRDRYILRTWCGSAHRRISCIDAKPHIGTDVLSGRAKSAQGIVELGGQVRFGAKLTEVRRKGGCGRRSL